MGVRRGAGSAAHGMQRGARGEIGERARRASENLVTLDGATKVAALKKIAQALRDQRVQLLQANAKDIPAATEAQLAPALIERLKLNDKRIAAMADGLPVNFQQVNSIAPELIDHTMALMLLGGAQAMTATKPGLMATARPAPL